MNKRLFNNDSNESYTGDGDNLDDYAREFLQALVEDYVSEGYSIRDVELVLYGAISDVCCSARLRSNKDV